MWVGSPGEYELETKSFNNNVKDTRTIRQASWLNPKKGKEERPKECECENDLDTNRVSDRAENELMNRNKTANRIDSVTKMEGKRVRAPFYLFRICLSWSV